MMKYEIFKKVVADTFKDYLPEQYRSMDLRVESVNKVNRILDGITLVSAGADKNISPTVYINDMYDHYKLCNDLKEAIKSGADRMVKAFRACPEIPKIELSEAKDNIIFQLVNKEQNRGNTTSRVSGFSGYLLLGGKSECRWYSKHNDKKFVSRAAWIK